MALSVRERYKYKWRGKYRLHISRRHQKEMTDMSKNNSKPKIVVVSAYPNVYLLGCGGYLYRANCRGTSYEDVTCSPCIRTVEDREKYKNNDLDRVPTSALADSITKYLLERDIYPFLVLTHSIYDVNQQHRKVREATDIVFRPWTELGRRVQKYLAYEIPGATLPSFTPHVFVSLIDQELEHKIKAFEDICKEEVYLAPHPYSRRALQAWAAMRGTQCYENYAEAYEVIREVI